MLVVGLIVVIIGASIFTVEVLAINSEDQPSCIFNILNKFQQCIIGPPPQEELTYKKYKSKTASVFSFPGTESHMKDAFAMEEKVGLLKISLYGVFDRHNGDFAAKYAAKNLLVILKNKMKQIEQNVKNLLREEYLIEGNINYEAFLKNEVSIFEKKLLAELDKKEDNSGTTTIIALVRGEKIYVVNTGGSRAVVGDINGAATLLADQADTEISRIEEVDGVSDVHFKKLSSCESKFIILASRGVWDKFSNEQAVQFINDNIEKELFGAEELALKAREMGSTDNITVMVIKTK